MKFFNILKNILFGLVIIISLTSGIYAKQDVLFFTQENCPNCQKAKADIEEKGLEEIANITYIDIEDNQEAIDQLLEYARKCNITNVGVPFVVINEQCYVGYPTVVEAIEGGEVLNVNIGPEGKENTQLLLITIPALMFILVGIGYFLKSDKKKSISVIAGVMLITLLSTAKASAFCPVCTIAVGAGLGLSRYLGIDDVIMSLWIGGLISSMSLMVAGKIVKKWKINKIVADIISIALFAFLLFLTLSVLNITGNELNQIWGIDKIVVGSTLGIILFYIASQIHHYAKEKYGKVLIPFQTVVIPVSILWLASLAFYFILYI